MRGISGLPAILHHVFSNSQQNAVNSKIQKHDDEAMLVNAANMNQHINSSLRERNFPTITGLMYT